MPFTKFTNLDFDQIKTSIKDYLRANSDFTGFDFEGSNFSVLIDTLAYNTYITAFNSNMVVNESFLDSATLRENVVSLARNIGYVPRSRTAATADISFNATIDTSHSIATLETGIVCVGNASDTSYVFSTTENVSAPISNGVATFNNVKIKQGIFLTKKFTVNASLDQRFLLDNSGIDTSTIKVYVNYHKDATPEDGDLPTALFGLRVGVRRIYRRITGGSRRGDLCAHRGRSPGRRRHQTPYLHSFGGTRCRQSRNAPRCRQPSGTRRCQSARRRHRYLSGRGREARCSGNHQPTPGHQRRALR